MLSNQSRVLTYLMALLYTILGGLLFFMPGAMAPVFAWKVTPFMTMTIGGWCFGNAWLGWVVAQRWQWSLVQPSIIYLWLFGLGESIVVLLFRGKLSLTHPIAWLYVLTLLANILAAGVGLFDLVRIKPAIESSSKRVNGVQIAGLVVFTAFVGFLGLYGSFIKNGSVGTNGGIFPEIMSTFTLRSFGVFYLSLSLAVVSLFWNRNLQTQLSHGFASYGLIVFITAAAFAHIKLFDFVARPGGLLYFAAYLGVGMFFLVSFIKYGVGVSGT